MHSGFDPQLVFMSLRILRQELAFILSGASSAADEEFPIRMNRLWTLVQKLEHVHALDTKALLVALSHSPNFRPVDLAVFRVTKADCDQYLDSVPMPVATAMPAKTGAECEIPEPKNAGEWDCPPEIPKYLHESILADLKKAISSGKIEVGRWYRPGIFYKAAISVSSECVRKWLKAGIAVGITEHNGKDDARSAYRILKPPPQ